jgi:DNA polymerase elongation subunit (family B)
MQLSNKPTKMNVGKPFRLIDFKTFDETLDAVKSGSPSGSDDSDSDHSDGKQSRRQFMVQMFGVNEQGNTCSIIVYDFKPFFFLHVGDNWDQSTANAFMRDLYSKSGVKWLESQVESVKLVDYNKLYGFSAGKKDRFIQVTFHNQNAFNRMKNMWYRKNTAGNRVLITIPFRGIDVAIYESNIPPLLRYFHIKNISPSGWVNVQYNRAYKPGTKSTTCTYECICTLNQLIPMPEKETCVPYKIMSFDIEASSSHGDFPLPQKTYKKLAQHLVDAFLNNFADPTSAPPEMIASLTKQVIMTAFGHASFDDVDLVYPKREPTKSRVLSNIDLLLKTPLDNMHRIQTEDEEDKSKLLTIGAMFDKMRATDKFSGAGEDGSDEDSDAEPEAEERDDSDDDGYAGLSAYQSSIRVARNCTIIDLLISDKYNRDAKITRVDEALTQLFPPLKGDEVTFIGSTFMKYGEHEPYLNHCFVVGSCDPVDGTTIETTTTEREMLVRWTDLVNTENPDSIIGYNIFGFDYEFMFRRAIENNCTKTFLLLSRRVGELCVKDQGFRKSGDSGDSADATDIEHTTIAIASGDYDLKYIKMTGRLQVDMYMYLRREYNFGSYKLDDMASYFISDDIKRVEAVTDADSGETVTHLYSKNLMGLHVGDFIHVEITSFTSDYYAGGKKFVVSNILLNQPADPTLVDGPKTNIIVIEGDHSELRSYKNIKWGMAKDDVTPQDIFRLTKGSAADRARVAKYCIQDCNLVHHLMNKVDVLTGYVEMASICSVPISFLVFRGQGIKLTSYVAKKCRAKDTLMPDLEKSGGNEGYEGAIVLPPKCSMYMDNPVACVDYASLYPSSMISQNFSHDSKVWTREYDLEGNLLKETGEKDPKTGKYKYDELPGYEYIDIEFDTFRYVRKTSTSAAVKTKCGKKVCRWAQFPDNKKGIMPSILEELLKARSDTRKKGKTEPDPFMQNVLDKRQLGYKVTANSLYGQCGAKTSSFYEKDVAASTTATGRMMITYARRIIEEVYGNREYDTECHGPVLTKAEYVYGDSVANYTPVYVRTGDGKLDICTIESLAEKYGTERGWDGSDSKNESQNRKILQRNDDGGGVSKGEWVQCEEPGKQTKEFCEMKEGVETWTEKGWTRLHRVIRHTLAQHKKMIRVLTHTGLVDVTDDHSLLREDGTEISPKEVKVGDSLLHSPLPGSITKSSNISENEAKIMGFFFGDGSCGEYACPSGKKCSWALNNASMERIEYYLGLCREVYPDYDWVYMDTIQSSGVYKISPRNSSYGSIVDFVKMYRDKLYNGNAKVIPNEIMESPENIRRAFWQGLYDADGDKDVNGYCRIDQKNQISAAHIAWLAQSIGYKTSINTRSDKDNIYRITMTTKKQRLSPVAIKKMGEITYEGYVYDLTTDNHHFAAGIGNLIVHNTDSVFFTFNLEDPKTGEKVRGPKALEMTIEIAQDAAALCTRFLKPPMELSYEKTLMPFILLKKKRYVGMLYETDPKKGKLKYMGLSIKRRDSCDYLKDVYGGILNILMKENDIMKSVEFLHKCLEELVAGRVPMDKLTITRALSSYYKNPQTIAHRVLADRIGKRDPGNKPKPGDRLKFVFFENPNAKLQGEKIELPEYIESENLKIDYAHYITRQLMKPLQQLYGLGLEQIWENQKKQLAIRTHKKEIVELRKKYPDQETFAKKHDDFCSKKVKPLLFDKWLVQLQNQKNNAREITGFFKPTTKK